MRWSILAGSGTIAGVLSGCGGSAPPDQESGGEQARSALTRETADPETATGASAQVGAFTADLYRRLSRSDGNLVCSPYSVAVALAMARTGARGRTAAELDRVLHASGLPALNAGLGALDAALEKRSGPVRRADRSTAKVELRVANSLWGQRGPAWRQEFLDALARYYGAGMRLADYIGDAEAARSQINAWTEAQTGGKIERLIPPGVLSELTRMVLVNAVYLKAPWEQPFEKSGTTARPFTRVDGSAVDVPTMSTKLRGARYARGDGWQAVELRYAGNGLAMTVILPDRGALDALDNGLDGSRLSRIVRSPTGIGELTLRLPAWKFRTSLTLNDALRALGMRAAFDPSAADFSGMTTELPLFVNAVLHQAYVAVDEAGTEAAAATAVTVDTTAARPEPAVLAVDRPFLFVIHDVATATPLFVGRVVDPST